MAFDANGNIVGTAQAAGLAPPTPDWGLMHQQLLNSYTQGLQQLHDQQQGLFTQYGFKYSDPGTNPDGTPKLFSGQADLDPTQQYGLIQTMLNNQGHSIMGALDAARAAGLGDTGLGAQRAALARYAAGAAEAQLMNQFTNTNQGLFGQYGADVNKYGQDVTGLNQQQGQWEWQYAPIPATAAPGSTPAVNNGTSNAGTGPILANVPGQDPGDQPLHGGHPVGLSTGTHYVNRPLYSGNARGGGL